MAIALDTFHADIASSQIEVKGLVLKVKARFQGETVWATLRSEQWPLIVHDGDIIRLEAKGTMEPLEYERPTVTFKIFGTKDRVAALLPQRYEVSCLHDYGKSGKAN